MTSYKKWIVMALLSTGSAFGLNAQSASFTTPTTNFDLAGGTVTFTVQIDRQSQTLSSVGFEIDQPTGWSYVATSADFFPTTLPNFIPSPAPAANETTPTLGYAYQGDLPNFRETFGFTAEIRYPSGLTSDQVINARLLFSIEGGSGQQTQAMQAVVIAPPLAAPAITAQPMPVVVNEGGSASFTVAVTGNPSPTFQWKKNGGDISGANSATYDVSVVAAADAGDYTVVVTNSEGSVTSSAANLSVNASPTISTQPMSMTVNQGQDVSFSVTAAGATPLSYQWNKEGSPIAGETNVTLQINGVQPANAGSYTVVVTNSVGMVTSSAATLTVVEPPGVSSQPTSQTLVEGASLSLAAIVNGTTPISLQWMKDGQPIAGATSAIYDISSVTRGDAGSYVLRATNAAGTQDSTAAVVTVEFKPVISSQPTAQTSGVGGTAVFSVVAEGLPAPTFQWRRGGVTIVGQTQNTLSLTNLQLADDGASIDVIVTNSVGTTTSSAVKLTVTEGPAITAQPMSVSIAENSPTTFTVTATGNPAPAYQWKKNGADITGETGASLSFSGVARSDAGEYTVVVTNSVSAVTSAIATLEVTFTPVITTQPTAQTSGVGGTALFSVVAEGLPDPTFQWRKGGTNIVGETNGTLSLTNLQLADDGASIDVIVTNSVGTTTSSAVILSVTEGPAITAQPMSASIVENNPTTFTVTATGNPAPTYQWKKNGADITGETGASLSFSGVAKSDAGEYTVVVTNSVSAVTSAIATLEVTYSPVITTQPVAQTSGVGGTVVFSVVAEGMPAPTFQWRRGGVDLAGETGSTLSLSNLQLADDKATFDVLVTNSVGSTPSDSVALTVNEGPAITAQPTDVSVPVGSPAIFTVTATGNPAPTYQWKKDGTDITGETGSSLSFSGAAKSDDAEYSVVVTNSVGSVTSANADLEVLFKPEITKQPTDLTGSVGGSVTFSALGLATPDPTYQWFRVGTPVSGATQGDLTLTDLKASENGATFYVEVQNSQGTTTSNIVTLTVNEGAAITTQPIGLTVTEGGPALFSVVASGNPAPSYQWKKGGVDISGATSANFDISVTKRTDSGEFTVVVDNGLGSATSTAAVLDVQHAPEVTMQPIDTVAGVGGSATFTADGTGNPEPTLQWFRNGSAISGGTENTVIVSDLKLTDSGDTFYLVATNSIGSIQTSTATLTVREIPVITTQPSGGTENAGGSFTFTVVATGTPTPTYQWRKDGSDISGATTATLTLSNLEGSDAGSYDVVVSNAQGSATSSAATLVVPIPPVITTNPVGSKKVVGESFAFTVVATGTAPLSYQWQKDGADVAGATSATLTLTGLKIEDAGSYSVTVTNSVGPTTSVSAVLEVDNALKAPTITRQPADTSVRTGESATITVTVEGNPLPTYQWFKNNVAIAGQTAASLTISNAQAADQSGYHVEATNSEGSIKSNLVRLTVSTADVAPVITSQPRNRTAALDGSVTFSISATGVPEPTYQWKLNGVDIAGATSASHTITSLTTDHAGNYSVEVTNSAGTVTSRNALLVVITRSHQGTYFGSFGTGRGQFAITIGSDNTGTFLGFDEIAQLYISGDVKVNDDGTFTFTRTSSTPVAPASASVSGGARRVISDGNTPTVARAEITISGTIGENGGVTGTVEGVDGLSMSGSKEEGSETEGVSGYYEASASGSDAVTYTIIAPNGKVLVFTETAEGADAGVGTVTSEGQVNVTTVANNTVTATVVGTASTIQTEVTDSSGAKTSFSGGGEDLIATQRLVNISSRAVAGAGEAATIAGLVITGEDSKPVLIRAVGPGLAEFGVTGVLSAPTLDLFSDQSVIASNTGWANSADSTDIIAAANLAGAFTLDAASADSAILETLPPGAYTAKVSGSDGGTGVVLVEVYDLSSPTLGQKLFNISTRASAGAGNETVVAGFVVAGSVPKRVLMRGVGPTLGDYGVTGALSDPKITLFRDTTVVATNDNWGTNAASVTAASSSTGAFQLAADSKDAAMVISLEPGVYTLHMSGVDSTSGIGLIEVYEIP